MKMINQNLGKIYRDDYLSKDVSNDNFPTFYSYLSSKFDNGGWVSFAKKLGYEYEKLWLFVHEVNLCMLADYNASIGYKLSLDIN